MRTLFLLFCFSTVTFAAEYKIKPGENPQLVLDAANPGDKLTFLPGVHQHGLGKHRSILYVDKAVEIELQTGAVLKLADGACALEKAGEITTDQDAAKKLDDLEIGGNYDLTRPEVAARESYGNVVYTVAVDGVGENGKPDTFSWGDGELGLMPHKKVPVTGDWQLLSQRGGSEVWEQGRA